MQCKQCKTEFKKTSNSSLYCSIVCRRKAYYKKNIAKFTKLNRAKHNAYSPGKIACKICGDYYHRPIAHAHQRHGISAVEYKKEYGYKNIGGVTSTESHEKSREAVLANPEVIENNLVIAGKPTRFKLKKL